MILEALLLVTVAAQMPFSGPKPTLQEAMQFIASIKDEVSIELTDASFEHETQASTGATTGDWFVFFYHPGCQKCTFMAPEWKFLADRVKEQELQVNIAKMDVLANPETTRRLRIMSTPTYLYFKGGYYYNFTGHVSQQTLDGVVKNQDYLQFEKKPVPAEMTYWMDWYYFLRWWVIELKVQLIAGTALLVAVSVGVSKCTGKNKQETKQETTKPKRD